MSDSNEKFITIQNNIRISTYYLVKNRIVDYNTTIEKTEINNKIIN